MMAPEFYTLTMAKVYADQGLYAEAAEIYRFLLKESPERGDLKTALAEIEMILAQPEQQEKPDPAALFREWLDLLLRYRNLRQLQRLKRKT